MHQCHKSKITQTKSSLMRIILQKKLFKGVSSSHRTCKWQLRSDSWACERSSDYSSEYSNSGLMGLADDELFYCRDRNKSNQNRFYIETNMDENQCGTIKNHEKNWNIGSIIALPCKDQVIRNIIRPKTK